VDNQSYVFASASMACADDSFVHQDGVRSAGDDPADGRSHIFQALDRPDRNAVVHWNNNRFTGIAVDYSLQSYHFSYHCQTSNPKSVKDKAKSSKLQLKG